MTDKPVSRLNSGQLPAATPSPEQVAAYLRDHPQFFVGRDALLSDMLLPHGSTGAISLVERQLGLLRERNQTMRRRLNDMVRTARINHRLFERTLALTLQLMELPDNAARLRALQQGLASGFDVDSVALHGIEQDGFPCDWRSALEVTPHEQALEHVGQLLRPGRIVCGLLRDAELQFLFPDSASQVASAAVMPVPLQGGTLLIALGSRDPDHFTPDMGTLFIRFLGDAVARMLQLPVPATSALTEPAP